MTHLSKSLYALRAAAGLSQERAAERLGVSRQAFQKWESGESLPEADRLVPLADLFGVPVDALLRPGCGAKSPANRPHLPAEGLAAFLVRAKRATYAGKGPETLSSRPSSHDLRYEEGNLLYIDSWLGGEGFAGEEAVWDSGVPVWAMNYAGRTLGSAFSGDFLKAALAAVDEDAPFRGPAHFRDGEFSYHRRFSGDAFFFSGMEEIFAREDLVYECFFHGGALGPR